MGVSGDVRAEHISSRRAGNRLPMPPLSPNREHADSASGGEAPGAASFRYPDVRATRVPYNGRGACMRCRWCVGFACEVNARYGLAQHRPPHRAGHRQLRTADGVHGEGGRHRRSWARAGRELFRCQGRAGEPDRGPGDRLLRRHRIRAAAAQSARASCFRKAWATATTGWAETCRDTAIPGRSGCFDQETYDDIGPGAQIAICDYNHGNSGTGGGAMLANEFIRLPIHMVRCRRACRAGAKRTRIAMRASHRRRIVIRGRCRRCRCSIRASRWIQGEGPLGIPGGAHVRHGHPHTLEIARPAGERRRGVVEGSRRDADRRKFPAPAERRPAPGGHLPHGQRSQARW